MEDFFMSCGGIITIVVVCFVILVYLVIGLTKYDCKQVGQNTNRETQFSIFGGGGNSCLIKVNNKWIPTDKWIENTGK